MPHAALKPCSYPSCPNLVKHGYCQLHRKAEINYHNQDAQKLYGTARWQRLRRLQLSKEPWCAECLLSNIYTPATDVDHIQPHRGNPQLFYKGPFQSLCHSCHSRKTAGEVFVQGRGA